MILFHMLKLFHSKEAACKWAKLAAEWFGYELGKDSNFVRNMRMVVGDPRQHQSWGTRESMNVGGPEGILIA